MTQFVRAANPIWWIPDLTGFPLNDTYFAFFLTNDLPYIFQNVYQTPNGTPWANPLQFLANGTLPNNLYFDPMLTYRIEIRQGNTQADSLIYLIENFVAGEAETPSNTQLFQSSNMITNPQFADIAFNSPVTYAPGSGGNHSIPIGPGWRLDLVGNGTITLTRNAIAGSNNIVGDPTYYLRLSSVSGWTSVKLIQQFNNNGAIFANGACAIAFTAISNTSDQGITVDYVPSTGIPNSVPLFAPGNGPITAGGFKEYKNAVNIDTSTNAASGTNAFVDIVFNIPSGSDLSFTNIQIVGQSSALPPGFIAANAPSYQQQTYERTVDQEFNVQSPKLSFKPIPSYLVGWDFAMNPAQIAGDSLGPFALGANTSFYSWDQTIIFQSVTNSIAVSRSNGGISLTTSAITQAALIQYLTLNQIKELLQNPLSVYLSAFSSNMAGRGVTVSLWYTKDASLPLMGSNNSLVATLDANGKPATFHGNWLPIPALTLQDSFTTIGTALNTNTNFNEYPINGWWQLNNLADSNAATFFAIVIGTQAMANAESLTFDCVGLQVGNIATRPAPKTFDEVLRECEFYYEKSYELQTVPPFPSTSVGIKYASNPLATEVSSGALEFFKNSFQLNYKVQKRTVPTVTFFALDGTTANVQVGIYDGTGYPGGAGFAPNPRNLAIAGWSAIGASTSGILMRPANNTVVMSIAGTNQGSTQGEILYHYQADARLGIV